MSSALISATQQTHNLIQGHLPSAGSASSSSSSSVSALPSSCTVYIGAEPNFSSDTRQVADCFHRKNLTTNQANPSLATHFFLFITDSFLKSKELILPLITLFVADPHFKQRLFPVIMGRISIFGAGQELEYAKHWGDQLQTVSVNSAAYTEIKTIEENIAPFIRALRDTLMPPLSELLQKDLSAVSDIIEQRSHLVQAKRFFFLPQTSAAVGQEAALLQLSSLFESKLVVTLCGEAGIGKTTLAIEYAKRSQVYSSGIFWLDASSIQTLKKSFLDLATQLGASPMNVESELFQMKNFLLIYDDVTDMALIPSIQSGHSLIIGKDLANADILLGSFSPEDTACYLSEQLGASAQEAVLLGDLLENHPAKLANAVAYMKSTKISIQSYVDYYLNDKDNLLAKQEKLLHPTQPTSIHRQRTLIYDLNPSAQIVAKFQAQSILELSQQIKTQDIQIFVSYCWKPTKDPVNRMDAVFKSLGINLLRDERELRSFDSLREFMKKVIREADYTLSIINDNYLQSFNCIFEIVTTMQDPNWMKRVFPIVLPGSDIFTNLAISRYQKFWEQEAINLERSLGNGAPEVAIAQDAARKIGPYLQFVREMNPDSIERHISTQFKEVQALMLARQEKLEKKGIYKQSIFHLPMGRNKDFTGRDKEMSLLEQSLKTGKYSAITNTGMGGVGKSQLALEYAYRHEKEYNMVYWIRSEDMSTLKSDLRMLGLEMGIAEDFLKDDKIISTMKGVLENRQGWLLVFDNAEDPKLLAQVIPQRGGHILITSRNKHWDKTVSIDVFSQEEALLYLQKISGVSGQEEELKLLAKELGHLPLALTQAGAYIRRQGITVAYYYAAFKKEEKQMLSQKEKGYPGSVATAWLISMEKIEQEDPNATKLLNICSFLAPDNIPESVLEAWLKAKNKVDSGLDFQDALRVLESYSLIDQKVVQNEGTQKKLISIHRLIQAVTRDECQKEEAQSAIQLGIDVLNQQLKGDVGSKEEREAAEALAGHAMALVSHAETQEILSEQVGNLVTQVGLFLWKTGD